MPPRWSLSQLARLALFPTWKWSLLQADNWAAPAPRWATVLPRTAAGGACCAATQLCHRHLRQAVHGDTLGEDLGFLTNSTIYGTGVARPQFCR